MLLFFYLNRILLYQIKILSLDKFEENDKQQEWQSSVQVRIYIFAFLIVIFMLNIYLNEFFIFFLGCSFWIHQIYLTTVNGTRNTPGSIWYVICMQINIIAIPLYLKGVNGNFLFMKPDFKFFALMLIYMSLQFLIMKI